MHETPGEKVGLSQDSERIDMARRTLSSIFHDINNPLSIIAGNTQLLKEVVISMGLGDDVVEPVEDIEKATEQMVAHVRRIAELKEMLS